MVKRVVHQFAVTSADAWLGWSSLTRFSSLLAGSGRPELAPFVEVGGNEIEFHRELLIAAAEEPVFATSYGARFDAASLARRAASLQEAST